MLRTVQAKDAPDRFIVFKNESKVKTNLSNIGVASDEEIKNYNPDLKVRG
mgnify:FL=1